MVKLFEDFHCKKYIDFPPWGKEYNQYVKIKKNAWKHAYENRNCMI